MFETAFGRPSAAVAAAPGRVNLLGEHTDYNDGFVLPVAIPQRTRVAVAPSSDEFTTVESDTLGKRARFTLDDQPFEPFARYVHGCLVQARGAGIDVPPLDIHVSSEVPMGVGLSSSAALEVAVLRAVRELLDIDLDDVHVAQLAQRAEIEQVGLRCGIMDQMAASLADTSHALFLDTRSLERRLIGLPQGSAILVIDSGLRRSLATEGGYNERRSQCEAAARALGVRALRDVNDVRAVDGLPQPLRRRARHVVTENARVLEAVNAADAAAFGRLMNASHASMRDDFEITLPMIDRLVALLQNAPGVFGARMTGGGFGGACVALCDAARIGDVAVPVIEAYTAAGGLARVLVG